MNEGSDNNNPTRRQVIQGGLTASAFAVLGVSEVLAAISSIEPDSQPEAHGEWSNKDKERLKKFSKETKSFFLSFLAEPENTSMLEKTELDSEALKAFLRACITQLGTMSREKNGHGMSTYPTFREAISSPTFKEGSLVRIREDFLNANRSFEEKMQALFKRVDGRLNPK